MEDSSPLTDILDAIEAQLPEEIPMHATHATPKEREPTLADYRTFHPEHERALEVVEKWLENWRCNLVLVGPSGRGKTWLARCLMGEVRKRHGKSKSRRMLDWAEFAQSVIDREDGWAVNIELTDFVILDDIGTWHNREYGANILRRFLDIRAGKPTVITSNLSLGQIADTVDSRVASRLIRPEGSLLWQFVEAPDFATYRKKK